MGGRWWAPVLLALFLACGGGGGGNSNIPSLPPGPGVLSQPPIALPALNHILSLGWMNPVGHTIPTDHIYFGHVNKLGEPLVTTVPVVAPGDGTVQMILRVPVGGLDECKIWFQQTGTFSYYLDHVVPDAFIREGVKVTAGQRIGQTGISPSLDLGVIDQTVTLGFLNPSRYADQTLHCGKPLTYFPEPLRTQLYALVERDGPEKDGRIDYDVAGRLIGNWFLDTLPAPMDNPTGWDKELAFAYECRWPTMPIVSIGGQLPLVNKWTFQKGAPPPETVQVATGLVVYELWSIYDAIRRGTMLVQMLEPGRVKVQVFEGIPAPGGILAFDAGAKIYIR